MVHTKKPLRKRRFENCNNVANNFNVLNMKMYKLTSKYSRNIKN